MFQNVLFTVKGFMLQFGGAQTLSYKVLPPVHPKAGGFLLSFLQETTVYHCLQHPAKGCAPAGCSQSHHTPLLHRFLLAIVINKVMILSNACQGFHCFLWGQDFLMHHAVDAIALVQCAQIPYSPAEVLQAQLETANDSFIFIQLVLTPRFKQCYNFLWENLFDFFIQAFISYAMTPKSATGILYKQPIQQAVLSLGHD